MSESNNLPLPICSRNYFKSQEKNDKRKYFSIGRCILFILYIVLYYGEKKENKEWIVFKTIPQYIILGAQYLYSEVYKKKTGTKAKTKPIKDLFWNLEYKDVFKIGERILWHIQ